MVRPGGRTCAPETEEFQGKVVFSRTLTVANWANTTIARGDLGHEIGQLRRGGDGYIVVHGGISLWRSLARLDLIDE